MPDPARGDPHLVFGFSVGRASSSTFLANQEVRRSTSGDLLLIVCTVPPARWPEISNLKFEISEMTVIDKYGQALKGVWWMSWHREAKKDVVACDKLREAGKRALIRRFPNEETRLGLLPVTPH